MCVCMCVCFCLCPEFLGSTGMSQSQIRVSSWRRGKTKLTRAKLHSCLTRHNDDILFFFLLLRSLIAPVNVGPAWAENIQKIVILVFVSHWPLSMFCSLNKAFSLRLRRRVLKPLLSLLLHCFFIDESDEKNARSNGF